MKKSIFILLGVAVAFITSNSINATSVPYDMYVDPGTHSCVVTWEDDDNSAWNLRYRLYSEEPQEPVLLHSLTGSAYTGSYADITLPAPWGGVNVRGGNSAIQVKNLGRTLLSGHFNHVESELLEDAIIPILVGFGKVASSHAFPHSKVIKLALMSLESNNQITQSLTITQLTEHHRKQLIPAGERFYVSVSLILSYNSIEFTSVKKIG